MRRKRIYESQPRTGTDADVGGRDLKPVFRPCSTCQELGRRKTVEPEETKSVRPAVEVLSGRINGR